MFTRTTDRIEVIDIDDVTFRQGMVERALGVGTIVIESSDRTHPRLVLAGIDNVSRPISIMRKVAVRSVRNRNKVELGTVQKLIPILPRRNFGRERGAPTEHPLPMGL